ncbi:hypothetical protein BFG04_00215 [Campylobacter pinnipediorum subsp. pinnipediorum]|uniref:Glycosyltransferase, family 1 n=1 Tax=Campylobacter pinnipediorum subsp. pinnipediorum TaxID=1660067 RepID=A0AAX0LBY6_9BACT|nr:hypothetical protein [Campylobacter pinnipediorum]OPA79791.1 hypothetical protein BFG05_01425 [Campylobacter pinnipediorum subsp. pinnipediorum]OPA81604.1 hypothetical protein BFG04_00215 [Campylobacter pinnipediorum subsp. pinnipediorum]
MKTLLFISDKDEKFNHSFIQNVINGYLKNYFHVYIVYFTDTCKLVNNDIYILKKDRSKVLEIINDKFLNLNDVDFVIVRNFLDVLKNSVKLKSKFGFKLYFQLSFPHFYRPYHEAKIKNKNVLFKFIKYKINLFLYRKFINKCDGFFPISNLMVDEFFKGIKTKVLALPMGLNKEDVSYTKKNKQGIKKFIYIGAVDINRNLEYFFNEFSKAKSDFIFEIYTKDYEYTKKILPNDNRFLLHHSVEKNRIFEIMQDFDIGCFYVPINKLYNLCSPTKVMDYYACGLVSFSSKVNECNELFDKNSMFFVDNDIAETVDAICGVDRQELNNMSILGLDSLLRNRNYKIIAEDLFNFIQTKKE